MRLDSSRITKLISIIGFICTIQFLMYIRNAYNIPNDISFYNNLSYLTYFLLLISFFIITISNYTNEKNGFFYYNYLIFFLLNVIIVSQIWILKYNLMMGVDWWFHLHSIVNCMNNQKIDLNQNFYPILTILISSISSITKIDPYSVYIYFPIIHVFVFGLFAYLTIEKFKEKLKGSLPNAISLLILLINPIIIKDSYLVPWTLNFIFLAMYVYLSEKSKINNSTRYTFLLIICLIIITATHVIGAIYILLVSILMYISLKLADILYKNKGLHDKVIIKSNYILLICVILLTWIFIITGFRDHQLARVVEKVPEIIYGNASAQQTVISNKSLTNLLRTETNIICNTILAAISLLYILFEAYKVKDIKGINFKFSCIWYIFAGAILYFVTQFTLGKTDYNIIQVRYLYYTSIIYPILILYAYKKLSTNININILMWVLIGVFLISILSIYPKPEFGDIPQVITDSTYSGVDWGRENIVFNENSKILTGADYLIEYIIYKNSSTAYPTMYGSTNGLLTYLNYDAHMYKHRQDDQVFAVTNTTNVYIYYYPLMRYYVAYSIKNNKIIGFEYKLFDTKNVSKIYDSSGLTILKLNDLKKTNLINN